MPKRLGTTALKCRSDHAIAQLAVLECNFPLPQAGRRANPLASGATSLYFFHHISSWHEPHAAFIWNVPDFSCCCLTPHGPCLMDSFLWSFYWPSVDEFLCVNSVPCTQHICIYISGLFTEVGSSYGRNCVLSIFVALAPSIVPTHRRCSINVNLNWTSMSGSEILRPA